MSDHSNWPSLLNRLGTLSDLARLRAMRLLQQEELSVGELARALQLPQSTISRHLKLLHAGGWVSKRAEGTASLYRIDEAALDDASRELWSLATRQLGPHPTLEQDDQRLEAVLADRQVDSKAFFGRVGGEWDQLRHELFGDRFTAEALLGLLTADWIVADLGCGTGNAAEQIAPFVKKVIAIDREDAMLEAARKRLAGVSNIEFRAGDIQALPLQDEEVDASLFFLVLHHVAEPLEAVAEAARSVRPGGAVLIVDMVEHDRDIYRNTMGHRHLGFGEEIIAGWAAEVGLTLGRYHRLRPDTSRSGPGLFAAALRKP